MIAEAENNLDSRRRAGHRAEIPRRRTSPYLATVGSTGPASLACAVHIAPFKLVITRANREPIVGACPGRVRGGARSRRRHRPIEIRRTTLRWRGARLSGVAPMLGMRLRIHETRKIVESDLRLRRPDVRPATADDQQTADGLDRRLRGGSTQFRSRSIPSRVVADAIARGRLYVWDDGGPVSMAAWTGKTPNGVRINFVYTPARAARQRLRHGLRESRSPCSNSSRATRSAGSTPTVSSAASPNHLQADRLLAGVGCQSEYLLEIVAGRQSTRRRAQLRSR